MQPFPRWIKADSYLIDRYPKPPDFARACAALTKDDQIGVLRSFIVEGVPAFFRGTPTLYDTLRRYVAYRLDLLADDVTIIGSARIGYSLSPPPAYGTPFGSNSDLDLAVVSRKLFEGLAGVFAQWKADVEAGRENPKSAHEHVFWEANLSDLPSNIKNGFIDSHKLPNRYELAIKVNQTKWMIAEKLKQTLSLDHNLRASIRVYRDWDAFYSRQLINLRASLKKLPEAKIITSQY